MICRVGDVVRQGRVVRVGQDVSPGRVADAIRTGAATRENPVIAVDAPDPIAVHEYVGCLRASMGCRTKTALAAAGRSRGLSTPHDEEIRTLREQLDSLPVTDGDVAAHRRAVAETSDSVGQLREQVAELRGRLRERRRHDLPTESVAADLEAAIAELSEVETTAAAAAQRLDRVTAEVADRRDARERRMCLEDRIANLERGARSLLVDNLRDEYIRALEAVPDCSVPEDPFTVDGLTAALAVGRVADLSAPVILACNRFDSARAASDWLDAAVVDV